MNIYKDDLEAALARAETAERRARIAEQEAESERCPRLPKPPRRPGVWGRWWKQNWGDAVLAGVLVTAGLGLMWAITGILIDGAQRERCKNDIRGCIVRQQDLGYGKLRAVGVWEIVAKRPYIGDLLLDRVGTFDSPRAAVARAFQIGCPMVAVEK